MMTPTLTATEQIGRMILEARERGGISQLCLAAYLGLQNHQFISAIERGQNQIPPKHIRQLLSVLDLDTSRFIELMTKAYLEELMEKSGVALG